MTAHRFKATLCGEQRRFRTLTDAERFARAQCAKSGERWRIESMSDGTNGQHIANVSRDNAGRIWTDVWQFEGSLI